MMSLAIVTLRGRFDKIGCEEAEQAIGHRGAPASEPMTQPAHTLV
jgi:hypothetical protein